MSGVFLVLVKSKIFDCGGGAVYMHLEGTRSNSLPRLQGRLGGVFIRAAVGRLRSRPRHPRLFYARRRRILRMLPRHRLFYARRRRILRMLPRYPLFLRAAVASYGCFPGTPGSFMRAAVASYGCFPGTPGSFMRAAVASYGCFPGTPGSFMRAAVASYGCFPGTPAMGGAHTGNGKINEAKPQRALTRTGQFLGRPAGAPAINIGRC
ncbi:Transcriptional regulator, GntR family domain / Aspartate aminotransferase [hydrothermal vent metagenome]|uniref:Transcriptional regulator, GntR family domain / Aspartate aminotransferase n=1 Tax=hydrothermal vent metagenome TaxID=652676 RepID=A0A3B0TNE1_9ZZZZ